MKEINGYSLDAVIQKVKAKLYNILIHDKIQKHDTYFSNLVQ